MLRPVLKKVVLEKKGAVQLAMLDVDNNQQVKKF